MFNNFKNLFDSVKKDYDDYETLLVVGISKFPQILLNELSVQEDIHSQILILEVNLNDLNTTNTSGRIILPKVIQRFFKITQTLEIYGDKNTIVDLFSKFMIKYKQIQLLNLVLAYDQFIESVRSYIKFDISLVKRDSGFNYLEDVNYICNIRDSENYVDSNSNYYIIELTFYNDEKCKHDYLISVIPVVVFTHLNTSENKNPYHNYKLNIYNDTLTITQNVDRLVLNNFKIRESYPDNTQTIKKCLKLVELEINHRIKFSKRNTSNFFKVYKNLEKLIKNDESFRFKEIIKEILPFGSVTQFSYNILSDLEMTLITIPTIEINENDLIKEISKLLLESEYKNIDIRYTKRTKLINFQDIETNVRVEMMLNNYFGVINSELIRNYCLFDIRCLILINTIKDWSKTKNVNGNFNGYLSSYAYTLMMIYFLQRINILPIFHSESNEIEKFDHLEINKSNGNDKLHYFVNIDYNRGLNNSRSINLTITVSELLINFFIFYLHLFNEMDYCIDVSQSKNVYRYNDINYLNKSIKSKKNISVYCIIDPIDYSYNPAGFFIKNSDQEDRFKSELRNSIENMMNYKSIFN